MAADDSPRSDLIASIAALAARRMPAEEAAPFAQFVRHCLAGLDVDDVVERASSDLYGMVLAQWQFMQQYAPGESRVRVFNPVLAEHGWEGPHTVIEAINEDMPFLVDSLTMEANRQGYAVHLITHPVLHVRRDAGGKLLALAAAGAAGEGRNESVIHAEIDRRSDPAALAALEQGLTAVFDDVRAAVQDFKRMQHRLVEALAEAEQNPPQEDAQQVEEERAFLQWLADGNFTFLGYRAYDLVREGDEDQLRVVEGSGLGILRKHGADSRSASFAQLPPELRAQAHRPQLLILTKSNARATVHRPVYMDHVGIKRFDAQGRVVGEHRFLGLYTSTAYNAPAADVPLLRRKVAQALQRAGYAKGGHAAKSLAAILDQYPRDELFQIDQGLLFEHATGILQLGERQRLRLFMRRDPWGRSVSCLIYVPREKYNTELRQRMQQLLVSALGGSGAEFSVQLSESVLARVLIVVRTRPGEAREVDLRDLERQLVRATRRWDEGLQQALVEHVGEEAAGQLMLRYAQAFPAAYREDYEARHAVQDIELMESLDAAHPIAVNLYAPIEGPPGSLRFKLLREGAAVALSDSLPVLENMGLRVIEERPYAIARRGAPAAWIHDFGLQQVHGAGEPLHRMRPLFEDAFLRVWAGDADSDGLNRLVLAAGMSWREVALLRAYVRYMRQAGFAFSQSYIEQTLALHAGIARQLLELFVLRFDPARSEGREALLEHAETAILAALDGVAVLDEDRILRQLLALIRATVRSNWYQRDATGQPKVHVSLKLASRRIPGLPEPKPLFEIFVYAPRVEGVHLRGGKVARGGLRWSDRYEDYRTEVLGLVKAQQVKNAVIVPVGSKGGFVVKRPPPAGDRDAYLAEGVACYKTYLRGLLDITDNLQGGAVLPPKDVVRHDEDDPYLVVAADKGTAAFSDYANGISAEYGFWLDDAFASGGSAGYDHKKMGITARGAWESVRAHFAALGLDPDRDEFTVVGVGDMSGDVFGNGMLLSRHIKLLAAFDHRHIFLDPGPDPEASFAERERMFALPRSSWADYDVSKISAGGGVFPRSAKSVPLAPEIRAVLGVEAEALAPADLMQAILRAPVDLLYNGGIGTYVKARAESHAGVGDRANDAIRVNGAELRCRVVSEGGNLGCTQRGRIEYALAGGRINTDAIDNSGGVDCSDHEVNIKILLGAVVGEGEMTVKQRNVLLAEMTDEVAELVLDDNRQQNRALALAVAQGVDVLDGQSRFMRHLETAGRLNRALEFLPDDDELAERRAAGRGLTSPENAVLLAYAKLELFDLLLASDLPELGLFARALPDYFPAALRARYPDHIARHPLKREIIATMASNELVNRVGATFLHRLAEETGAVAEDVVRAYGCARAVFDVPRLSLLVDGLRGAIAPDLHVRLLVNQVRLLGRGTRWFARRPDLLADPEGAVARLSGGVAALAGSLADLLQGEDRNALVAAVADLAGRGVPQEIALREAGYEALYAALDIADLSARLSAAPARVAAIYFSMVAELDGRWLAARIGALPAGGRWAVMTRNALRDELAAILAALTEGALAAAPDAVPDAAVTAWRSRSGARLERVRSLLAEVRMSGQVDAGPLAVVMRELRGLV